MNDRLRLRLPVQHSFRAALCFAVLLAVPGGAQIGPQQRQSAPGDPLSDSSGQFDSGDPIAEERRMQALNADRQKSMVADTNKLLKVAGDLDAEIGRTNPEVLSANQLRKIAEIEKLARSIKEKMSTSVRGVPALRQPPIPMPR